MTIAREIVVFKEGTRVKAVVFTNATEGELLRRLKDAQGVIRAIDEVPDRARLAGGSRLLITFADDVTHEQGLAVLAHL